MVIFHSYVKVYQRLMMVQFHFLYVYTSDFVEVREVVAKWFAKVEVEYPKCISEYSIQMIQMVGFLANICKK